MLMHSSSYSLECRHGSLFRRLFTVHALIYSLGRSYCTHPS